MRCKPFDAVILALWAIWISPQGCHAQNLPKKTKPAVQKTEEAGSDTEKKLLPPDPDRETEVYFSPNGGGRAAILREVRAAKIQILVMAYVLTDPIIVQALIDAHNKGVEVKIVLDYKESFYRSSKFQAIKEAKIPVRLDKKHAIAHNKTMVIDSRTVINGSYNFSLGAQFSNAENLEVDRYKAKAAAFAENWKHHWDHSEEPK